MRRCTCTQTRTPHHDTPVFTRILHQKTPTREYCHRPCTPNVAETSSTHWGQLKLLLSEIEFLTPFWGEVFYVIYAGAAPGIHIPVLASMFQSMHFILVDPQSSVMVNGEYSNIHVMQLAMTSPLARDFADLYQDRLLLISDVRVAAKRKKAHTESGQAHQKRVQGDMENQRAWVQAMRPVASILKFRLPWNDVQGTTLYPEGSLCLPVYGRDLTHESRLVVQRDARDTLYDNKLYEGQMAYFSQVLRPAMYPNKSGTSMCYDCTAFHCIINKYLVKAGISMPKCQGYEFVKQKCWYIEKWLLRLLKHYGTGL